MIESRVILSQRSRNCAWSLFGKKLCHKPMPWFFEPAPALTRHCSPGAARERVQLLHNPVDNLDGGSLELLVVAEGRVRHEGPVPPAVRVELLVQVIVDLQRDFALLPLPSAQFGGMLGRLLGPSGAVYRHLDGQRSEVRRADECPHVIVCSPGPWRQARTAPDPNRQTRAPSTVTCISDLEIEAGRGAGQQ